MTKSVSSHHKLAAKLLVVVVAMFGFGYALVPLYDLLCDITGLNGKTGQVTVAAAEEQEVDTSRIITVKFIASINSSAPWEFKPNDITMKVHPGGIYRTSYLARNRTEQALVGQAVPSVAPREASLYFNKTECFCFTQQSFAAGEQRDMPVQFIVDRDIPKHIDSLVLSYTFFNVIETNQKS